MSELPDLSDEEMRRRTEAILRRASRHVAMALFVRGTTPDSVEMNGTVSFVHLPRGKVIVTNHHVWDKFCNERAAHPEYRLAVTGEGLARPIDISEATVISESPDHALDLVVLDYPAERIELVGKEYMPFQDWPPARSVEGDWIAMAGFPGMRRSVDSLNHPSLAETLTVLAHEPVFLQGVAEAVSPRAIRFGFQNPNPEMITFSPKPITEFDWGGMSGSLVYRGNMETMRFVPCGILKQGDTGFDIPFYATHLDVIGPDGTITEPA